MNSILIFISLTLFAFAGYLVWPSRYNVVTHGSVAAGFISIFVPSVVLGVAERYPEHIVNLYTNILLVGVVFYILGNFLGFYFGKRLPTKFSFNIMDDFTYESRIIKITKYFLIAGVIGLALSYAGMGFVPVFEPEPIAAKLFRNQYQEPYLRVAVLFRVSFFLIGTVMPIACIIWYKYRSRTFLFAIIAGFLLMAASLQRSGAFSGIVFAFILIMSFKSRFHFFMLMIVLIGVYVMSSFFYYIVGVKTFNDQETVWEVIGASSPEIQDQLDFLIKFDEKPVWTYGRTMYGGLIPGHYEWNPSVYTLSIIAPGRDVNEVGSGGLRLPLPLWGYVSFQWTGVIIFSFITGILAGLYMGLLKKWLSENDSILINTAAIIAFSAVFSPIIGFTLLNMYTIPPAIAMLIYLYRFKWK